MDKDYCTAATFVHSNGKNKLFAELFVLFKTIFFVKKHTILYGWDHTILFKFHKHVVQILMK